MSEHTLDESPLTGFHKKLAVYSSGGPFLDGYVLSIVGLALVQMTPQLGFDAVQEGLIGASALIGIFFGAFLGGWLADRFGREILYTADLIAIILFSGLQFWANGFWMLFVLRLLIGMAVGADYPIATSLLAEFTPRRFRGPLLGALMVAWFVGAAAAYIVGDLVARTGDEGWRWMLASAAVPGVIVLLLRMGTPESPRWLVRKGRVADAEAVVRSVFGPDARIDDLPAESDDERVGLSQLWRSGYLGRVVFVSVFWSCSVIPVFAVYAFGPKILGGLGMTGGLANMGSALIAVLFVVGCIVAVLVVNRIGRRALLAQSFLFSGIALLALGLFPDAGVAVLLSLFSAYAVLIGGAQVLQFIYPNELFPTDIRGSAVGLSSSLSRIGAAVGTYLVPLALVHFGIGATMLAAAGVTLAGFVVSVVWAPETRSLSLAEAAALSPGRRRGVSGERPEAAASTP
ncbi:MFS transporter [Streptomyces lydicus]|uniref:MFS transporter n=1 Tax=Streptomyces lydicus TaxID=47763 RepID=A0A3S9Y6Q9_9ACTN|nr:MFS transporter [Streptomyces lydicus]AZS70708.1 MFS transporter [Streptomyces lydicus]